MANIEDSFLIERYKYILDQKKNLNAQTFKITTFYQVITLAIFTGQFSVLDKFNQRQLPGSVAYLASTSLYAFFIIVTALSSALIIGGIYAWRGYRKDEDDLDQQIRGTTRLKDAKIRILSWYETYIIASFAFLFLIYTYVLIHSILPQF